MNLLRRCCECNFPLGKKEVFCPRCGARQPREPRWTLAALVFGVAVSAGAGAAAEEPSVTPYRPTVSNPAALPAPGWLELEAGFLGLNGGDDARRASLPYLAKLAFDPDWGLLVGGEIGVRATDFAGRTTKGFGDTSLFLKHRVPVDENAALGWEAGFKSPTARDGIGSGRTDWILNGIYSREIGAYAVDLNLSAARLGLKEDGAARSQWGWAAAVSREAGAQWALATELSGTYRRGAPSTSALLVAATYNAGKRVAFDFGAAAGLSKASPDWSVFAGVTVLAGRLW